MRQDEYEAEIAAFIRSKDITRCPTACASIIIFAEDRAALENYGATRIRSRQRKIAASKRSFWGCERPGRAG
jgi:hypothetical protein